jgi:hypothetical protein
MAKKKDPSITFLNKFGYNVIRLPRVGIEPMDIIGKDKTTQWLGPIGSVWSSTVAAPVALINPASAVNGQKTDGLDISFGIKVLANALAAFGATVPSLDVSYSRASTVQFGYTNVTSTAVAPLDAGNYLSAGTLKDANPVVQHYFLGQETEAYLIVDVLKSDSITVTATDKSGVEVGVDVPAIQGMVGANVSVKPSSSSNSTITYTGAKPVSFGFIVQSIHREGDVWVLQGAEPSGDLSFGVTEGAGPQASTSGTGYLLGTGCLIDI